MTGHFGVIISHILYFNFSAHLSTHIKQKITVQINKPLVFSLSVTFVSVAISLIFSFESPAESTLEFSPVNSIFFSRIQFKKYQR